MKFLNFLSEFILFRWIVNLFHSKSDTKAIVTDEMSENMMLNNFDEVENEFDDSYDFAQNYESIYYNESHHCDPLDHYDPVNDFLDEQNELDMLDDLF